MAEEKTKINLGNGRRKLDNYYNIDIVQYVDGKGDKRVDIIMDVEKDRLPFLDNTMDEVLADNVFEHLGDGFIFCLNEAHRVLKSDGVLKGCVPYAGTRKDFMDPTHKRHFLPETFAYFCGEGHAKPDRPYKPKYADYGILPWIEESIEQKNDMILFKIKPRKV